MRGFWQKNKLLVSAFALVLVAAIGFGIVAFREARDFDVEKEQPVAEWMTPRYIAHSWDVPRDTMMSILGLEPPGPGRQTLEEIAEERGIAVETFIAEIEAGIAAYRAEQGQ